MDFESRFGHLSQAGIEDELRQITDPLYENPDWNYLGSKDYDSRIETTAGDIRDKIDGATRHAESDSFEFEHAREDLFFAPLIPREHVGGGDPIMVDGLVEFWDDGSELEMAEDSNYDVERRNILWDVQRAYADIVDQHSTEYLNPVFPPNESGAGHVPAKGIGKIEVPLDYDVEEYEQTVNALDDIAVESRQLRDELRQTAQNF